MKISIIYTSQTGNTDEAAEYIQDGILARYPFIQVKTMNIRDHEVDIPFVEDSDAVIFGTPVYFTSLSWELKQWFDNSFRINLKGKVGAAFVTAQSPSGGTDTAIMEIVRYMLLKGMLVCSGMGEEAGHNFQIGAVGIGKNIDQYKEQFGHMGAAVAQTAIRLIEPQVRR